MTKINLTVEEAKCYKERCSKCKITREGKDSYKISFSDSIDPSMDSRLIWECFDFTFNDIQSVFPDFSEIPLLGEVELLRRRQK